MLDFLKDILYWDYKIFSFINGGWLFLHLAPVCLVVESSITYGYFKFVKQYVGNNEKQKYLKKFWKTLGVKLLIFGYLFWILKFEDGKIEFELPITAMALYYIYTFGVVMMFLVYLVKKHWSHKENFGVAQKLDGQDGAEPKRK